MSFVTGPLILFIIARFSEQSLTSHRDDRPFPEHTVYQSGSNYVVTSWASHSPHGVIKPEPQLKAHIITHSARFVTWAGAALLSLAAGVLWTVTGPVIVA